MTKSKLMKRSSSGAMVTGKEKDNSASANFTSYKVPALPERRLTTAKTVTLKEDPLIVRPSVAFKDVGGLDNILEEICRLLLHLKHPEIFTSLGVTAPRGMLLHGPPGCGKTLLAHAIAGELNIPLLKVVAPEVVSGISGDSEERLREIFVKAEKYAPCILFIDEIDSITPKRENASKEMERRIVAQLLSCLDDLAAKPSMKVFVIGATNAPDSLDPALRRAGRFDREISLGIPNEKARFQILTVLGRGLKVTEQVDWRELAHKTPGFVGADLKSLVSEAAMNAINRIFREAQNNDVAESSADESAMVVESVLMAPAVSQLSDVPINTNLAAPGNITATSATSLHLLKKPDILSVERLSALSVLPEDFTGALKQVQPSAKREGFATIPDVSWDDVGALTDIREELELAILAPVKYPEAFETLGIDNPSGILLCGPPGCGKTLLAKAVANESGLSFISVKGPELLNMYVGESERAVRQVFFRARNSSPCVIFFDEIDALCPRRSETGENNATSRVVNQLLSELDGLEPRKKVFVIGATNRPDILDPAMLRPGRLDKILFVDLPDRNARLEILQTITKGGRKPPLDADVNLDDLADNTANFSGADLSSLVREAASLSLNRVLKSLVKDTSLSKAGNLAGVAGLCVSKGCFDEALLKIRPSVSDEEYRSYQQVRKRIRKS